MTEETALLPGQRVLLPTWRLCDALSTCPLRTLGSLWFLRNTLVKKKMHAASKESGEWVVFLTGGQGFRAGFVMRAGPC